MQVVKNPSREQWSKLLERPTLDASSLETNVANVLKEVKASGDEALRRFTTMFDKVVLSSLVVQPEEILAAEQELSTELKVAIQTAKENITRFHASQLKQEAAVETMPGIRCWRKMVAIEKVGLYIPGGSAPLFSTILMLAVPAQLAGCTEIILCTPPGKDGQIHPAILYTAQLTGITRIFKVGGAQAIGAMAYGTAIVPRVYKIFGPGNQYVTAAKQLVQKDGVAIDMPAGPSEVCILADDSAQPSFVAADLLSQAEHGADSQVVLISTSEQLIEQTLAEVELQVQQLPRQETARKALDNSKAILVSSYAEAMALSNEYAPEHLIISCSNAEALAEQVTNAGSVFIGNYSPESAGDYASGTNHTLPTNGYARAYSGVSIDSFVKKITFQYLSEDGLRNIAPAVEAMAEAEGLSAHAQAVRMRRMK
jgi:histidinol dehydrogenase